MILITNPKDLEQQQEFILAMFFYLWMMGEHDAAEQAGELFDKNY